MAEKKSLRSTVSRVRKRQDREEEIVKAAAALFQERGYHGVTVDDIAQALSISKLSIYYCISSKEEILYRIHDIGHNAALEGLRAILATADSPDMKLRQAIVSHVNVACSEMSPTTAILQQEYALSARFKRKLIKKRDEYERMFCGVIEDGVRQGAFIECDPRLIAKAILGAANYTPHWFSAKGRLTKAEISEGYADYLVRGLLRSPAPALRPAAVKGDRG